MSVLKFVTLRKSNDESFLINSKASLCKPMCVSDLPDKNYCGNLLFAMEQLRVVNLRDHLI